MHVSFDIETIRNPDVLGRLPEPSLKLGNTKDPAKIREKQAEAKQDQLESMALDPLTGRLLCFCVVNEDMSAQSYMLDDLTDKAEVELVTKSMTLFSDTVLNLVTWNGVEFDIPFVYKRAAILGVRPKLLGAPVAADLTKRYQTGRHVDLMQVWCNWRNYIKLDYVSTLMNGNKKTEIDYQQFETLFGTAAGKKKMADYCIDDGKLTMDIFLKIKDVLI